MNEVNRKLRKPKSNFRIESFYKKYYSPVPVVEFDDRKVLRKVVYAYDPCVFSKQSIL